MTATSKTSAESLGPDALTWKYFDDLRIGMMSVWISAIQNMYPELGAGVGRAFDLTARAVAAGGSVSGSHYGRGLRRRSSGSDR